MPWIFYAIVTAMLWGITYLLLEKLVRVFAPSSVLLLSTAGITVVYATVALAGRTLASDMQVIAMGGRNAAMLGVAILANAAASFCLLAAMKRSNATLAGLVEISYPFFTALFAWLLFREQQLSPGTLAGGLLILSGCFCVWYFSKGSV